MYMQANVVEVKVIPPVGTIVLNRPDESNTINMSMVDELRQAFSDLHQEKRVRAVLVTGAGSAFCAGRDLAEMAADHDDPAADESETQQRWGEEADDLFDLVSQLLSFPKPIISSVNGPVGGFGVALLMVSDMVIACDAATLSIPDARHGLVAGLVTPLLAHRAGVSVASRLAVVGQAFEAAEAHRLGIYHELVPFDLLWARSMELGKQSAVAAPQAVGLTKRLLMETVGEKLLTDLSSGAIAAATSRTTGAAREGLRAFVEQREPEWE